MEVKKTASNARDVGLTVLNNIFFNCLMSKEMHLTCALGLKDTHNVFGGKN